MQLRQIAVIVGGAVVALAVGLGVASLAVAPVFAPPQPRPTLPIARRTAPQTAIPMASISVTSTEDLTYDPPAAQARRAPTRSTAAPQAGESPPVVVPVVQDGPTPSDDGPREYHAPPPSADPG